MKLLFCILAFSFAMQAAAQVTGNVLARVFQIRFNGMTGTAFILDYEDRQYFVTANHVVASAGDRAKVDIYGPDSAWHTLDLGILHGSGPCADVAVLVQDELKVSTADPLPYLGNFTISQEVYFLGFPFGFYTSFPKQQGAVALVKHGYISASVSCAAIYSNGSPDDALILLDGLNNHGFSGGPVVGPDVISGNRALNLIGVISSYTAENTPISQKGQPVPDVSVATNTGIVVVVPIERAIELIKQRLNQKALLKKGSSWKRVGES